MASFAFHWTGNLESADDLARLWRFCPRAAVCGVGPWKHIRVPTVDGELRVEEGDWIVKEDTNAFYPIREAIFESIIKHVIANLV